MSAPERIWMQAQNEAKSAGIWKVAPWATHFDPPRQYILSDLVAARIAAAVKAERERVFTALCAEEELMHPSEDDQERTGRRNAIRGAMVRLGMYRQIMKGSDNER